MPKKYAAYVHTPDHHFFVESEHVFDTAKEAWEYLAHQRMGAEDFYYPNSEAPYSPTVYKLTERASVHTIHNKSVTGTVYGATPGQASNSLETAYTVYSVED